MIHRRTHPNLDQPGCFACKVASVRVGANSTTSNGADVAATVARERRWGRDMGAYKRLRGQGLQPKRIDGAAHLEAMAEHPHEVESGTLMPGRTHLIDGAKDWYAENTTTIGTP